MLEVFYYRVNIKSSGRCCLLIDIWIELCSTIKDVHNTIYAWLIKSCDVQTIIGIRTITNEIIRLLVQHLNTLIDSTRNHMVVFSDVILYKLLQKLSTVFCHQSLCIEGTISRSPYSIEVRLRKSCIEACLLYQSSKV